MGVLKHLRTIFPLPRKWDADDELQKFGLRLEDAYRWLQTQRDQDYGTLTKRIKLTSGDTTWAKIWKKISVLETYEAALIYIYYTSMSTLSGGELASYSCGGVIWRTATGAFRFHLGDTNNNLIEASITSASSSSRGSFSYASLSERSRMIYLTSSDTTWAKVWEKINVLSTGETGTIYVANAAVSILTSGTWTSGTPGGIIQRTSSSAFNFLFTTTGDAVLSCRLSGASSSSSGTWDYIHYRDEIDALKELNSTIYHSSSTSHIYSVPTGGSRNFVIFSGAGTTYVWIGFVYCNTSGSVSTIELYKGSRVSSVTSRTMSGASVIEFTLSASSATYLRCIALNKLPLGDVSLLS